MTEQKKSWLQLSVACLCIILIWGFFLPWLGEQEAIKNHIESMEAKGIDPAAMFYTDIDAMELYYRGRMKVGTRITETMEEVQELRTADKPIGITVDPQNANVWVSNYSGVLQIFEEQ